MTSLIGIDQASTTLLKAGEEPFDVDQDPLELIPRVFTAAKSLLEARATISTRDGSYFMKSGLEAKGKILMLGPMAAFASGPESGLLALAGTDSFRVVHTIPPETLAPIFDEGRFLEVTPVFLIDRLAGMDVDDREKPFGTPEKWRHHCLAYHRAWFAGGVGLHRTSVYLDKAY